MCCSMRSALKQESDERIVNFVSRVKAKARKCEMSITCSFGRKCDYTDQITLYLLIAGLSDPEIQEELLVIDDITLDKAEQKAVTKESAKYSQSKINTVHDDYHGLSFTSRVDIF